MQTGLSEFVTLRRTNNTMTKRKGTHWSTKHYLRLHNMIPTVNRGDPDAPKGLAITALQVSPVVLLLNKRQRISKRQPKKDNTEKPRTQGIQDEGKQQSISQTRTNNLVLDTPVNRILFGQIEGYIYVDYVLKCCTQLKICVKQYNMCPFKGTAKEQTKSKVKHSDQLGYINSVIFLQEFIIYVYFMSLLIEI